MENTPGYNLTREQAAIMLRRLADAVESNTANSFPPEDEAAFEILKQLLFKPNLQEPEQSQIKGI